MSELIPVIRQLEPEPTHYGEGFSHYYRIAFLDFIQTANNLLFTLIAKFVFVVRDVLVFFISIAHSLFLIPLDFLLILTHIGLRYVQRDVVDAKMKKWKIDDSNETQLKAAQVSQIADLNYARRLFWSGNPISIRSILLMNENMKELCNEPAQLQAPYSSGSSIVKSVIEESRPVKPSMILKFYNSLTIFNQSSCIFQRQKTKRKPATYFIDLKKTSIFSLFWRSTFTF